MYYCVVVALVLFLALAPDVQPVAMNANYFSDSSWRGSTSATDDPHPNESQSEMYCNLQWKNLRRNEPI